VERRFSNANSRASLARTETVLSSDEVAKILAFCDHLHLDYGELDILRDNGDGLIVRIR
jgi:hypothetical protein